MKPTASIMGPNQFLPLKALIVEDEQPLANLLRCLVADRHPYVTVVGTASTGLEALALSAEFKPDLIFLDIGLGGGMNGFTLLKELGSAVPFVIITTASRDHAIHAFQFEVVGYLLKPIAGGELDTAMNRVMKRMGERTQAALSQSGEADEEFSKWIEVPTKNGFKRLPVGDILYAMASGSYTDLYMLDKETPYTLSKGLSEVEKRLGGSFLRVHKSYLVNPMHVLEYSRTHVRELIMRGGINVPVARERSKVVKKALKSLGSV